MTSSCDYPLANNPAYQIYSGKTEEEELHCEACGDKCEELFESKVNGWMLCENCNEWEKNNRVI